MSGSEAVRVWLCGQPIGWLKPGSVWEPDPGQSGTRLSVGWNPETLNPLGPAGTRPWFEGLLPENGMMERFRVAAALRASDPTGRIGLYELLEANTQWEYPGAVSFGDPDPSEPEFLPVNESELAARLTEACRRPGQAKGPPREFPGRWSSLCGARGKIGAVLRPDGQVLIPVGTGLSTHIYKVEDNRQFPAEAGIESVCMKTLRALGLKAAETRTDLVSGIQVVISRRFDRVGDPADPTRIRPVHQEDFAQATGTPGLFKFESRRKNPGWPVLHRILQDNAQDPEAQTDDLIDLLAAAVGLRHSDGHRKNVALLHSEPDQPFGVSLAPAYDVSSAVGVPNLDSSLALGIGGQNQPDRVGLGSWVEYAQQCRIDPDRVLGRVDRIFRDLPDALQTAQAESDRSDRIRDIEDFERRFLELSETVRGHFRRWSRQYRSWSRKIGLRRL